MAADAMEPQPLSVTGDAQVVDTRTPSPVPQGRSSTGDEEHTPSAVTPDEYKPDLSAEVAMLSTKLVNAINYQTNLDDTLQQTRHELDRARQQLEQLRAQRKETEQQLGNGQLMRKPEVDQMLVQLREEAANERVAKEAAEKAKKQTEGEVEALTSALFEEANTMVAAARRETEAAEKRNTQLRGQLQDTEVLLTSQQAQLQDLKTVLGNMERLENEREHTALRDSSVPTTPVHPTSAAFDALQLPVNGSTSADIPPDHPLHFTQLLAPVLRNDMTAYADFEELLLLARRGGPHSRNASGAGVISASGSQTNLASSSPGLPGAFSFSSTSASNSPQASTFAAPQIPIPPLKESKFYRRTLIEDIEPTLRLDLAPGLSFLSRRTVMSSLLLGSLVVEPFAQPGKFYGPTFACALCGESRKQEPYIRKHRFRTSEEGSAQRYPLCHYCLPRVRSTGDFVGFLRMVRDGHWRADSDEEQKGAWEESVRLRERMFWARVGGGVVPAWQAAMNKKDAAAAAEDSSSKGSLEIPTPASRRGAVSEEASALAQRPRINTSSEGASDSVSASIDSEDFATKSSGLGIDSSTASSRDPPASVDASEDSQPASQEQQAQASEQLQREADAHDTGVTASTVPPAEQPPPPDPSSTGPPSQEPKVQITNPTPSTEPPTPALPTDEVPPQQQQRPPQAEDPPPPPPNPSTPPKSNTATANNTLSPEDAQAQPQQEVQQQQQQPPIERRPSAVLARVRAMEAKAQGGGGGKAGGGSRTASPEKRFPGAFE